MLSGKLCWAGASPMFKRQVVRTASRALLTFLLFLQVVVMSVLFAHPTISSSISSRPEWLQSGFSSPRVYLPQLPPSPLPPSANTPPKTLLPSILASLSAGPAPVSPPTYLRSAPRSESDPDACVANASTMTITAIPPPPMTRSTSALGRPCTSRLVSPQLLVSVKSAHRRRKHGHPGLRLLTALRVDN